ncbi:rho GTPase-activating protein 5-like isoform X2 [Dioscorea cayenensis subsp. rotundata]|uniref:Rho GTPase-activating protein 5-like isoform X2 n=1 Tax=Dioscorea cayennensis subsp. rotundata TaxID=55577 RepID=A0AB40B386_DIOCR|nr:rho GTPase-activating protein 5-like isoform X2 [Dioscorea cayenensis subsp. rotundata]
MAGYCPSDEEVEEQLSDSEFGDPLSASSSPLIFPGSVERDDDLSSDEEDQFSVLNLVVATLRKSLVMCSAGAEVDNVEEVLDIGRPTDVRHVSHVTFDRFDGFLGLPVELERDVPSRAPSASASIFGLSAKSMQCSHDNRGNSVPTILLLMQKHLYSQGGLKAEGIFRINAENSHEAYVREQLSTGLVPHGIDVHCLAGLIKAWFRELPSGVLDCITPDQMMHCNTEEECSQLIRMLAPTEAALLDWAINLMADVVKHENDNKMNARNIAMVFAPNMTQMADPLTALIHAVQVMNFLKTLIMKTLREREDTATEVSVSQFCLESPGDNDKVLSLRSTESIMGEYKQEAIDSSDYGKAALGNFLFSSEHAFESDKEESFRSFEMKSETLEIHELTSGKCSPINGYKNTPQDDSKEDRCDSGDVEGILDRLNFRRSVRKLCRHPVFQFSKTLKKTGDLGILNSKGGRREACTS